MSYYLLERANSTPQYTYPRRGGFVPSGTIIIHTAECAMDLDGADDSAENCANFIATRADYGSYHRLVDSDSIIPLVPFAYEAWQDTETNGWGIGISAAVAAGRWHEIPTERRDRIYRNMAAAAAEAVTYMRDVFGVDVPIHRISGDQARAGVPGFCAHGDSGLYRSDPGAQFDWATFFAYTTEALGGTITPAGATTQVSEGEKMIVMATDGKSPQVWIGDGIVRRPVWSLDTMTALQWLDRNKVLGPFYKDGEVQTIPDLNAIGIDLVGLVGKK